jgi:predicted GTPase
MTVNLTDLSHFTDSFSGPTGGAQFSPAFTDSATAAAEAGDISDFLADASGAVQVYADSYTAKQHSFENQGNSLLSQADVLQSVVDNRTKDYSSDQSIAQLLLEYILSDSGKIVDESA